MGSSFTVFRWLIVFRVFRLRDTVFKNVRLEKEPCTYSWLISTYSGFTEVVQGLMFWGSALMVCTVSRPLLQLLRMPESWKRNNEKPFYQPSSYSQLMTWVPDSKTGSRRRCRCHVLEHWNPGKPMVYTGRTDSRKPVISRQWKCQAAHRSNLKN